MLSDWSFEAEMEDEHPQPELLEVGYGNPPSEEDEKQDH